jgi:ankyrin repeat protein
MVQTLTSLARYLRCFVCAFAAVDVFFRNLHKDGNTPIILAAIREQEYIVILLLKHGANPEIKNSVRNISILAMLLAQLFTKIRQIRGTSALLEASKRGCIEICSSLIGAGSDIDYSNKVEM